MSSHLAVWIWYRGECFRGFQAQVEGPTVQQSLWQALGGIGVLARPVAAGRTDSGVHARMQVLSLRTGDLPADEFLRRMNLQPIPGLGIAVARALHAPFHPQWSGSSKEYRYRLRLVPGAPQGWERYSWNPSDHLRITGRTVSPHRLAEVLAEYAGTRTFAAFHERSSPVRPRTIEAATLTELESGLFEVRIRGDRFARYLVRFLVGTAVAVAAGVLPRERVTAALEGVERVQGVKAPAHGLILWDVRYPSDQDPFTASERELPPGLPENPPFQDLLGPP